MSSTPFVTTAFAFVVVLEEAFRYAFLAEKRTVGTECITLALMRRSALPVDEPASALSQVKKHVDRLFPYRRDDGRPEQGIRLYETEPEISIEAESALREAAWKACRTRPAGADRPEWTEGARVAVGAVLLSARSLGVVLAHPQHLEAFRDRKDSEAIARSRGQGQFVPLTAALESLGVDPREVESLLANRDGEAA